MQLSESIQLIATFVEGVIAILALLIALQKRKMYGGFIAITFALFVIFDIDRIFSLNISAGLHAVIFLLACLSMLYAVWLMWKDR
ncbi:hypothetical protein [uncultured Methanoregula sp.]|uniref:hypothetical protein n=1 Tax=uncultured Methanoregula sp. TaxID=1005933 RepID=UPI002AAA6374|nr:hypothetical protein [uncultured Methanoregula sp.]